MVVKISFSMKGYHVAHKVCSQGQVPIKRVDLNVSIKGGTSINSESCLMRISPVYHIFILCGLRAGEEHKKMDSVAHFIQKKWTHVA
jgi:hypothetical protein